MILPKSTLATISLLTVVAAAMSGTFLFAPQARAQAQEAAKAAPEVKPSPGPAGELLEMWERIAKMNIDMAEQFPEEKYGYKPTPEVRSFKEQMLHVASGNYFFIRLSGGETVVTAGVSQLHAGQRVKAGS